MSSARRLIVTAVSCLAVAAGVLAPPHAAAEEAAVPVQLLSITDLHGYFGEYTTTVKETASSPAVTVGGGAYLAGHLEQAAEGHPNSILFSAGDDFSGWPDETEWFWNEPTIEYLNHIGLEFSTVGNHELDRQLPFLQHMMDGTCEGRPDDDLCFVDSSGDRFQGADYDYYVENMVSSRDGDQLLAGSHIRTVDDGQGGTIPVGFVHATLEALGEESMSYLPTIRFTALAEAVNDEAAKLQDRGVEAIVLVAHEGFSQAAGAGYNECVNPFGPMVDYNAAISPAVDAIITGHWHARVNCMLPDPAGDLRPVVEAGSHGNLFSEINLELDPATGDVLRDRTRSTLHANTRDVRPDPGAVAIADYWRQRLAERASTTVARVTGDLTRRPNELGESTLGNATADAYLWAARQDARADLAVVLPGTMIRDISYAPSAQPGDGPGAVLFGEVAVATLIDSGIGHGLVSGEITGRQLDAVLEAQWQAAADGGVTHRPIAVSGNVSYRVDLTAAVGQRVSGIRLEGARVGQGKRYRVATTAGGYISRYAPAGITAFVTATDQRRSEYNAGDALWRWMEAQSPVSPPSLGRARAALN